MSWFHIHRFKLVDIHYERPLIDIHDNHMTFGGRKMYWDIETLKCRCGKEKKSLLAFYTADEIRTPLNENFTMIRLGNKRAAI